MEHVLESQAPAGDRSGGSLVLLGSPEMLRLLVFVPVVLITAFGLLMVYSSSMVFSLTRFGDAGYFFLRQATFAGAGLAVMAVVSRIPARLWHKLTMPLLVVSLLGLVACLTPLGITVKGASRWIGIGGGFNLQPSEIAKVAMVFWVSWSMSRKAEMVKSFKVGFLPHVLVAGVFAALCMKQPDFGAAMMILLITFVMVFIGGTRLGYLLGSVALLLPVLWVAVVVSPYRMKRVMAFLNPEQDALGINYQITESLISIGSGGLWGVGLGNGKQKLFFLPDAHTDFIAAIVGEELGMVGLWLLIAAFGTVIAAGIAISVKARDRHCSYLAAGLTFYLAFQVVVNLGVVMGLLPTKGLALPFMSYGGSSLLTNLFAAGVLMSLAIEPLRTAPDESGPAPAGRRSGNSRIPEASSMVPGAGRSIDGRAAGTGGAGVEDREDG